MTGANIKLRVKLVNKAPPDLKVKYLKIFKKEKSWINNKDK
jgi:hypothetical protein